MRYDSSDSARAIYYFGCVLAFIGVMALVLVVAAAFS